MTQIYLFLISPMEAVKQIGLVLTTVPANNFISSIGEERCVPFFPYICKLKVCLVKIYRPYSEIFS